MIWFRIERIAMRNKYGPNKRNETKNYIRLEWNGRNTTDKIDYTAQIERTTNLNVNRSYWNMIYVLGSWIISISVCAEEVFVTDTAQLHTGKMMDLY